MHISERGFGAGTCGLSSDFFCVRMREKEVFKRRERAEKKGERGVRVEEGREKGDAGFLNGGVFASLILGPI